MRSDTRLVKYVDSQLHESMLMHPGSLHIDILTIVYFLVGKCKLIHGYDTRSHNTTTS